MKKDYRLKKTLSARQFIAELGSDFSRHMKNRLSELGTRCVFTRKQNNLRLDLKHIEHTQYDSTAEGADESPREYAYGQFVINDGALYFSESCHEDAQIKQAPIVHQIYERLDDENIFVQEGICSKKLDDSNIDYVVDSILEVCPEVTAEHQAILSRYCGAEKFNLQK